MPIGDSVRQIDEKSRVSETSDEDPREDQSESSDERTVEDISEQRRSDFKHLDLDSDNDDEQQREALINELDQLFLKATESGMHPY